VAVVFGGLLSDAWPPDGGSRGAGPQAGRPVAQAVEVAAVTEQPLPGLLAGQVKALSAAIAPGSAPAPAVARALIAWTQLFGMISFELFGQLVGSADPSDDFFGYAVEQLADLVGLPG
jgi:Tetracyclin repressor-like, C-terminal domain